MYKRQHLEQLRDLEGPPPAADLLLAAAEDANRVVYLKAETDRDCVGMGLSLIHICFGCGSGFSVPSMPPR